MVEIYILIGVALIDLKLWRMMAAQRNHQQRVEALLVEVRDKIQQK